MKLRQPQTGLRAALTVAQTATGGRLRGRRLVGLLLVVGLPLLVQSLILAFGEGRGEGFAARFIEWVNGTYLTFSLPMVTIFLCTAAFGDEWEGGTAPYVVGLPVSRAGLVVGRWIACVRRTLVLVLPSLGVLYVLCVIPYEGTLAHHAADLGWIAASMTGLALGYAAVFLFFGLVLRHSIMISMLYVVLLEGLVANLPPAIATFSLSFHARNLMWIATRQEGLKIGIFDSSGAEATGTGESIAIMAAFTVAFLLLSTWVLLRKEFTGSAASETS